MDTFNDNAQMPRKANKCNEYDIAIRMIPMRDGISLHTRIYIPKGKEKYNVLLCRTPFELNRDNQNPNYRELKNGIISILQTCRGMGLSEGEFYPWRSEKNDAEDTIKWIKEQPWFDERIVMEGTSYCGQNALLAATCSIPELVGITPSFVTDDLYNALYENGAFNLYFSAIWAMTMRYFSKIGGHQIPDWDKMKLVGHLPYKDIDQAAKLGKVDYWRDCLDHPYKDEYWQSTNLSQEYGRITAPALFLGGWFDHFCEGTIANFLGLRSKGGSDTSRRFTRCIMGPWTHLGMGSRHLFASEFEAKIFDDLINQFHLHLLEDPNSDPLPEEPPFKYFMMGNNQWCSADTWPPKDVRNQPYYLHSNGCANSVRGNGKLNMDILDEELPDSFIFDSMEPVASTGGSFIGDSSEGCVDQSLVEKRYDVLVFTSEPMTEDLKIAGKVKVILWAASNAWDTDFTAKLIDVSPDGTPLNLCDGIIRASARNNTKDPEFLVPESRIEYIIECGSTANCFKVGHRIRLEISSSNYPEYDVNSNTGGVSREETERQIVRQVVFHEEDYPSRVILPILK